MRLLPYVICLLLVAACTSSAPDITNTPNDEFVASEAAGDVRPDNNVKTGDPKTKPLDKQETQAAALLINQLEDAKADDERNAVIEKLVELGPRYLDFYRAIDREEVALDMMFVIRRIERENDIRPVETVEKDDPLGTVKTHRKNAYAKLGISSQSELLSLFLADF